MKFRGLTTVLLGSIAMLGAQQASAAVTVLGNGIGAACYEAAEFGGGDRDGIETCTIALDETALPVKDRAATYVNRGILKSRSEDPNGALADYNLGISLDPDLGEAYVDRGAVMILFQRYEDALKDINQGIALGASKPQIAYYDRAMVDEALGDIRGAYLDNKKAVEIDPNFALAAEQLTRFKVVVRKKSDGT